VSLRPIIRATVRRITGPLRDWKAKKGRDILSSLFLVIGNLGKRKVSNGGRHPHPRVKGEQEAAERGSIHLHCLVGVNE